MAQEGMGVAPRAPTRPHGTVKYVAGVCVADSSMADNSPDAPEKKRQEPPPIEFVKSGEPQAPSSSPQQPVAWVTRPEDYQVPAYPQGPAPPRQVGMPGGRLPIYAGILLIAAGALGMAAFVYASMTPLSVPDYANFSKDTGAYFINQVCGLIVIWAQAAAILGGIMALQRMNWRLTLVCAILATLTIGFTFEASILGMIGFVLVIVGRKQFAS